MALARAWLPLELGADGSIELLPNDELVGVSKLRLALGDNKSRPMLLPLGVSNPPLGVDSPPFGVSKSDRWLNGIHQNAERGEWRSD